MIGYVKKEITLANYKLTVIAGKAETNRIGIFTIELKTYEVLETELNIAAENEYKTQVAS